MPLFHSFTSYQTFRVKGKRKYVPATVGPTDIPTPAPSSVIVHDSATILLPNKSMHALKSMLFTIPVKNPITVGNKRKI